jgi:hypothetical protein
MYRMNRLKTVLFTSVVTLLFCFVFLHTPAFAGSGPDYLPPSDFDGDGKTDISIYRPSNGQWWVLKSSDGSHYALTFGTSTDRIVPADYTGDGKTDIAVWRPSSGEWFILRSEDNSYYSFPFGISTDIPTPADYDGDGITDPAVYRPSTATWYLLKSLEGLEIAMFGSVDDIPANADYDGDGKSDISIRRVTQWWIRRSSDGSVYALPFSSVDPPSEVGLPGDYTGDGEADLAVYSLFEGHNWKFRSSENGSIHNWYDLLGIPAPGDYDGDQKMDRAVFNPDTGIWFILYSSGGFTYTTFGTNGDVPTPNAYVR